jgi:hypothetical protein
MMLHAFLLLALLQPARCLFMTVGTHQKQSVQQLDRRQLIGRCAAAVVTASSVLGAAASVVHADEAVVAEEAVAAPAFSETISYREFNRLLLDKSIKRASFYGTAFSNCIIERADGVLVSSSCSMTLVSTSKHAHASRVLQLCTQAKIGEGYPKESPSTDESPLKVVAQLRNAGVPYSVDFNLGKYAKRKVNFKSKDTMAAEGRQRDEDREVERLMQ